MISVDQGDRELNYQSIFKHHLLVASQIQAIIQNKDIVSATVARPPKCSILSSKKTQRKRFTINVLFTEELLKAINC